MRGRNNCSYPFNCLEMFETVFGNEPNTIDVCSCNVSGWFTVDINATSKPSVVDDGQVLTSIEDNSFNRVRIDPSYNHKTAKKMYGTDLPASIKLLRAGSRVIKSGSLMFLLLRPQNYQICTNDTKRVGLIFLSIIPSNKCRCLNIYYKYG